MFHKRIINVVVTAVLLVGVSVTTGASLLYSNQPAPKWQDALISGNGQQGILVFGDPRQERIVFNHEMLYEFMGTEAVEPAAIADVIPEVKRLIKAGRYQEAKDLTLKRAQEKGHPGILWTDPYHPACAMLLDQRFDGEVSRYTRTGQLDTGEIHVRWQGGGISYHRKSFVSRPDHVIVTQLGSSKRGSVHVKFSLQHQMNQGKFANKDWKQGGINSNIAALFPDRLDTLNLPVIEPAEQTTSEEWLTFRVKYQLVDRGYEVLMQVRRQGGEVSVEGDVLAIEGADSVLVLGRVIPIEPYTESQLAVAKAEIAALGTYKELLVRQVAAHKPTFDRVTLTLDKTGFTDGSNETLIAQQKNSDRINPYLLEKVFALGRFGLLCSSGKNPPNLMGIWNGAWRPNWSGDFTLDANVNLQISAANIGSMPEAIDSYMQLLERIAPDWEINARNLYGCRGYLSGTRTSGRRNLATHFGDWPGHYWTAGAQWLLLPCFEYVQCTGDRDFLKKRLLPMMKKVVLFYEDFLDTYDDQGHYFFAPSYSPENKPKGITPRVGAVANATMDIAVTREALSNLITVCQQLRVEKESIPRWQAMLEKLPPYLINEDGALKEWAHPGLDDNYDHRHVSHLYPVWPGLEINPEQTPKLYQAARVAAQKRGRGNGSAHGLSHMALIGARLKDAELVYGNLLFLMKNDYLNTSLFTYHNPGRIYNSDALHSIPAAILEALVYSRPGEIELLPAWSKNLPRGSVTHVGCRTEAQVKELRWDLDEGTLIADIESFKKQRVVLRVRRGFRRLDVDGEMVAENDDTVTLSLRKDRVTHVRVTLAQADSGSAPTLGSVEPFQPTWESLAQHYQAPEWFKDAKFGIYTHWGPVTVGAEDGPSGVQWYGRYMYQKDHPTFKYHAEKYGDQNDVGYKDMIAKFNPQQFDAEQWAELFAQSGARFAGPVVIHHDNYAMWDSAHTRWDSRDTAPQRDFTAELSTALRKRNMKFIATFHHAFSWDYFDWAYAYDGADSRYADLYGEKHDRGDPPTERYLRVWRDMVNEVVDKYEPDLIWFDFGLGKLIPESFQRQMFADYYNRAEQQKRQVGVAHKHWNIHEHTGIIDFERGRLDRATDYPWLTDTSVGPWFHQRSHAYKTPDQLIDVLVDIVSKNGCMLLNVGPTADGAIPAAAQELLRALGQWLTLNGEAIYATRPWLIHGEGPTHMVKTGGFSENQDQGYTSQDIRYTQSKDGQTLYALALGWPGDTMTLGYVDIKNQDPNASVTLLESAQSIPFQINAAGQPVLDLSKVRTQDLESDHAYAFRLQGFKTGLHAEAHFSLPGAIRLMPAQATLQGVKIQTQENEGRENIGHWDNAGDKIHWLVNIEQPGTWSIRGEVSCAGGPSHLALSLAGERHVARVPRTDGWFKPQWVEFEAITVAKPDVYQLVLAPIYGDIWKPVNVYQLQLVPAVE